MHMALEEEPGSTNFPKCEPGTWNRLQTLSD
jgi:hypothetical protein